MAMVYYILTPKFIFSFRQIILMKQSFYNIYQDGNFLINLILLGHAIIPVKPLLL